MHDVRNKTVFDFKQFKNVIEVIFFQNLLRHGKVFSGLKVVFMSWVEKETDPTAKRRIDFHPSELRAPGAKNNLSHNENIFGSNGKG